MDSNKDDFGFSAMTVTQLRKEIADMVKSSTDLIDDKKDYVAGVNEVLKETKKRMTAAVTALKTAEKAAESKLTDTLADKFSAAHGVQLPKS